MVDHGSISLTVTSPEQTFTEPLSLAEVKAFLRLPEFSPTDTESDAMVEALIVAAREQAEIYQGCDLVGKQWDLPLDYFPGAEIALRHPLSSVDLFTYKDSSGATSTLTEGTDFIVDLERALVMPVYDGSWPSFTPWPSSSVTVRFTTNPVAVRPSVFVGMKLLIQGWHSGQIPEKQVPFAAQHLLSSGFRSYFA